MEALAERFGVLGLEVEPFGGTTYLLRSVPDILVDRECKGLVVDILEQIVTEGTSGRFDEEVDKILMLMACHSVVRARSRLADSEIASLLAGLDCVDFAGSCPHGRPVFFIMPLSEIWKRFKRT